MLTRFSRRVSPWQELRVAQCKERWDAAGGGAKAASKLMTLETGLLPLWPEGHNDVCERCDQPGQSKAPTPHYTAPASPFAPQLAPQLVRQFVRHLRNLLVFAVPRLRRTSRAWRACGYGRFSPNSRIQPTNQPTNQPTTLSPRSFGLRDASVLRLL